MQLVLVGTTLEVSIFIFEIPTGVVADLYSRRLSIIIGFFLTGIGFLVMGSWALFIPILISQILWGLGYTFTSGATQAWISDEIGEEKSAGAFVHGAQYQLLGGIAGILIGTLLGFSRFQLPILLSGIAFLFLAFFLVFCMPEEGFSATPQEERNTLKNMLGTFRGGLGMLKTRPVLGRILLVGFFFGLYSEGYDRLWTAHLLEKFSFPDIPLVIWFGVITGVSYLLSAGLLEIIKRRLNFENSRTIITTLQITSLCLILMLAVFALSGSLFLSIGVYWMIAILREVNYPLFTAWTNQKLDSSVRATVLSMSSQADAIGQISGGPGVGWIAREFSIKAGILTSAALLSPVLLLLRNKKNSED
jgi:DHA3 family tetracycline resistance protein-like MFS transporter